MNKIKEYFWAYRNKVSNKLLHRVRMPAKGKKMGEVLISYITEPFTNIPSNGFSRHHSMYWECYEIAKIFSEKGYACDIVSANNKKFIPKKKYAVCFDSNDNLERFMKYLPSTCIKIFPILISHWTAYNDSEQKRIESLEKRRGVRLSPHRSMPPSRNAELADYLQGFGNKTVFATFKQFNKPINFIPASEITQYDFPENKDWNNARKNFLWIGGGGAVLKGLDIVLEAFTAMPDLELHVCGPVSAEKDFANEYDNELNRTPNIHNYGRINITGEKFVKIANLCGAVVYPSGGDGTSGAIIQAMHAGLVPMISHETGIQEDSRYIPLNDMSPQGVINAVRNFSVLPIENIKKMSKDTWLYARKVYTKEEFSKAYKGFIDKILKHE